MASTFISICSSLTRSTCPLNSKCPKVHYSKALTPTTQESLGDCSYLNSCHRINAGCRYLHWKLEDPSESIAAQEALKLLEGEKGEGTSKLEIVEIIKVEETKEGGVISGWADPEEEEEVKDKVIDDVDSEDVKIDVKGKGKQVAQWMNVDLRTLDLSVLGKFDVILPYGTLTDLEMMRMQIGSMQDPGGLLFLWVTGRAQDLGRECLASWGYERVDEIVWIKTSQKQGLIRTGRTGHWLNHSKEHCLVAVRSAAPNSTTSSPPAVANPSNSILPILDTQVIISEVRETSRKPIELYGIIERMLERRSGKVLGSPKEPRMVELFGRDHNRREGWLTLGNQFKEPDFVVDVDLVKRFNQRYPEKEMSVSVSVVDSPAVPTETETEE